MYINVEQVRKRFVRRGVKGQEETFALDDVSVGVEAGKMLALVGPSGSGKTTLLRCIAGLEIPDQGTIRIGDRVMFSSANGINVPTEQRNLGLIFQSYALWPNMTVRRNVAYPLKRRRINDTESERRINRYLDLVGCGHLADRFPHELSGGQQQRIALARALVYEPAVVLFDEPLSNLDPMLREHLRTQIRDIQRTVGFTGVYVTHDQSEAFYVGDHVTLLSEGKVIQAGSPDAIFRRPANARVAAFVGASNVVHGKLVEGGQRFESPDLGSVSLAQPVSTGTDAVIFMARPDSLRLVAPQGSLPRVTVIDRVPAGVTDEYALRILGGQTWRARIDSRLPRFEPGAEVALDFLLDEVQVFPDDGTLPAPSGAVA